MKDYLYYVYHLAKYRVEVIGIDEEIGDEIKGDIIDDSAVRENAGMRWSNRKSYLNSPEYDFSKEYIPLTLENIDKLNLLLLKEKL